MNVPIRIIVILTEGKDPFLERGTDPSQAFNDIERLFAVIPDIWRRTAWESSG